MNEFLENLKKAADNGEFNSDAAKKILEINKLADIKLGKGKPEDLDKLKEDIEKRYEGKIKPISEKEAIEINSQYEKRMEQIRKSDLVNAQLATLIEIEDMVKASIEDMFSFVNELEYKFKNEFETKDLIYGELLNKIEEIKGKYNKQ